MKTKLTKWFKRLGDEDRKLIVEIMRRLTEGKSSSKEIAKLSEEGREWLLEEHQERLKEGGSKK